MIPKVRDWLENQGFTLEMRTAAAFRAAGFEVRQASHYTDAETGKGREIDVIARDPDMLGIVDIVFVVECKSATKPWALLCSPDVLTGYNRMFAFGALSEKVVDVIAQNIVELLPKIGWLRKDGPVGYNVRQAFSDADVAYTTSMSVAKACDSWIHPADSRYVAPYTFAFPVVVVDSPILQCSLDDAGQIEISEVAQGEFLFVARLPRYFGSCVRLVSASRLRDFAVEAKGVADLLRVELKSLEQSVVDSWTTPKREDGA